LSADHGALRFLAFIHTSLTASIQVLTVFFIEGTHHHHTLWPGRKVGPLFFGGRSACAGKPATL
jgi:hypothetical protein